MQKSNQQHWQEIAAQTRHGLQRRVQLLDSIPTEDLPALLAALQVALQLEQDAACFEFQIEKFLNRPPYED